MNHKSETLKSIRGNRKSQIYLPIHPFTHLFIHFFMQNKPNFNHRHTQYDIRNTRLFMQNEPNFTPNAPTKHAKDTNFTPIYHPLLQLSSRQMRTFDQKCKKIRVFCKYLTLTHLTPRTTKTYINILPQNTSHGPRETSDEKMQNEPNLNQRATRDERQATNKYAKRSQSTFEYRATRIEQRKNAKQTQFHPLRPRVTGHESRVTIKYAKRTQLQSLQPRSTGHESRFTQNEPNFESKRSSAAGGPIHSFTHSPKNAKRTQFERARS